MSMDDTNCPYCDAGVEINHDDGYGYDEGQMHQQTCGSCDKTFAYTTAISFHYEAAKADCLNGGEHRYKEVKRYGGPEPRTLLRCLDCDHETTATPSNVKVSGLAPHHEDEK